jgi:hypothetical protein
MLEKTNLLGAVVAVTFYASAILIFNKAHAQELTPATDVQNDNPTRASAWFRTGPPFDRLSGPQCV